MSLRLQDLQVPAGLDFVIVLQNPAVSEGRIALHLQGLHEGKVVRHAECWVDLQEYAASSEPTPVFQAAIDKMLMQMHFESLQPLRLS